MKISASEDLETWKRRATEAMAEAEALRIERNERRVDMKELREEWKALHKELRDVKVQEMVARESAIRAETKLEKYMGGYRFKCNFKNVRLFTRYAELS